MEPKFLTGWLMNESAIQFELPESQALALAQLVKRIGWAEMRQNAVSDDEAYEMKYALAELQKALAAAGFAPR